MRLCTYDSRYYANWRQPLSPPGNHVFDKVVTARFELTKYWYAKVEGHFMNGYAASNNAHGFYGQDNTKLVPVTNMLVVRTGVYF